MDQSKDSARFTAQILVFCGLLAGQSFALPQDSASINAPASAAQDSVVPAVADTVRGPNTTTQTNNPASSEPVAKPDTVQSKPEPTMKPAQAPVEIEQEEISLRGGSSPDYRSPRKAMFLSLLVPGLGQYYARSKYKAAAFIAVEAGLFGFREYYNNRGDSRTREFRDFVDENFSDSSYLAWWQQALTHLGSGLDTSLKDHHEYYLDEVSNRTQQYYEVVYKYPQFVQGWKDVTPTLQQFVDNDIPDSVGNSPAVFVPPLRIEVQHPSLGHDTIFGFSELQLEAAERSAIANDAYRTADNIWFAILANHICSAVDAAFTARRYNRANVGQGQTFLDRLHIESRTFAGAAGPVPVFTARIGF